VALVACPPVLAQHNSAQRATWFIQIAQRLIRLLHSLTTHRRIFDAAAMLIE
jgi:hypothetical protein